MRLPAIPRPLLTETVTVREPAAADYGGAWGGPSEMGPVRVEATRALEARGYSRTDGAELVLYADAANTSGARALPVGSLVEWDGGTYSVVSCEELGVGEPHHWEVGLR